MHILLKVYFPKLSKSPSFGVESHAQRDASVLFANGHPDLSASFKEAQFCLPPGKKKYCHCKYNSAIN